MRHLAYRWDESRGDRWADWGGSWWYFEIDSSSTVVRQIEVYDDGTRLRYGRDRIDDEFGMLSTDGNVSNWDKPADRVMSSAEFEAEWLRGPCRNDSAK